MTDTENPNERRKKRRWGDAAPSLPTVDQGDTKDASKRSRIEDTINNGSITDNKSKAMTLHQSISARLQALKAKKTEQQVPSTHALSASTASMTANNNVNTTTKEHVIDSSSSATIKKAKVYDLDLSVTTPQFRQTQTASVPPPKKINPYLAHLETPKVDKIQPKQSSDVTIQNYQNIDGSIKTSNSTNVASSSNNHRQDEEELLLDNRLAGGQVTKNRQRHKQLKFVEPGKFIELAERKRAKAENATKSGFLSGRKTGTFVKATGMVNGKIILDDETNAGNQSSNTHSYYGHGGMDEVNVDFMILAPRPDAPEESLDGSTASSGGVVVIPMPLIMEWWDTELLPGKLRKEVVACEGKALTSRIHTFNSAVRGIKKGTKSESSSSDKDHANAIEEVKEYNNNILKLTQKCFITASITNSKTSSLIQHPLPVRPPNASNKDAVQAPTLHLTKKEMKRQRKLRRAERQRELQDMQAAGLIPPPEPRLTLSNFMKVLGDQAVLDPSKMEAKVMEQMQARKLKHEKMNAERKLTKEQRSEKLEKKLTEDVSEAVTVALFLVKDMSHRYHRTKVDLNAQQFKITGGVLECESPKMSLIICEGGPKAIKKYTRLMMVRMKWKGENFLSGEDNDDEDMDEGSNQDEDSKVVQKFNPNNTCELVWTGLAAKRMFNSFVFQKCETSDVARKILEAKGVAHFWDQVLVHAKGEKFNIKLGDTLLDDSDSPMQDE